MRLSRPLSVLIFETGWPWTWVTNKYQHNENKWLVLPFLIVDPDCYLQGKLLIWICNLELFFIFCYRLPVHKLVPLKRLIFKLPTRECHVVPKSRCFIKANAKTTIVPRKCRLTGGPLLRSLIFIFSYAAIWFIVLHSINLKLLLASGNCQNYRKWSVWIFFIDVNISHINDGGKVILPTICHLLFYFVFCDPAWPWTRSNPPTSATLLPIPDWSTPGFSPTFLNHVPWGSLSLRTATCLPVETYLCTQLLLLCLRCCGFPNCSLICMCAIFTNLESTEINGKQNKMHSTCCPSTLEKT